LSAGQWDGAIETVPGQQDGRNKSPQPDKLIEFQELGEQARTPGGAVG
jgi:hypothetical protein